MQKLKYLKIKQAGYSERERKTMGVLKNGRSADFIIPNFALGCSAACSYCYIARNQPFGNPLLRFTNVDEIIKVVLKHHKKLGPKVPNQCDKRYYTYDIGEATDCLNPQIIATTNHIISELAKENIKATFATKLGHPANVKNLVNVPQDMARIRMSVAPPGLIRKLELGSSLLRDRLAGIDVALEKGFEVHLNFSPVVIYSNWIDDYRNLMSFIDQSLSDSAKQQLKCEVIFLTHDKKLHQENLSWNPEAEEILWSPEIQEEKVNTRGSNLIRYKNQVRFPAINTFRQLLNEQMPYCPIRYIF